MAFNQALSARDAAASRKVHIVNGLSVPYRVTINGKPKHMRAKSFSTVEVREGDIDISVLNDDVPIPDQTCRITVSSSLPWALPPRSRAKYTPGETARPSEPFPSHSRSSQDPG